MAAGYPNLASIDDTLVSIDGYDYVPGTGVFTKLASDGSTLIANCTITYAEATAGPPRRPRRIHPTLPVANPESGVNFAL